MEKVFLIKPTALLGHRVGRLEVAQVEMLAAVDVEAFAQGVQRAFFIHHFFDALEEVSGCLTLVADQLAVVGPLFGLCGADKRDDGIRPHT